jgi:hypothetical protein
MGVAELYDYEFFFGGFPWTVRSSEMAKLLNIEVGKKVIYFPRKSFDMWNTRYFVLPVYANGWLDEFRAFASFLEQTERIYPAPDAFLGPGGTEKFTEWTEKLDLQVRRNLLCFPRAWVVHDVRRIEPVSGLSREARKAAMQEITYAGDLIWHDQFLEAFDAHHVAWVDKDQIEKLGPFLSGRRPRPSETVKVTYPDPEHVVLEATLESPGLLILADVYYPGWKLTIDDQPAPIYRVNRAMRGAALRSGHHRLVYSYEPLSFKAGCAISLLGFAAMGLLSLICVYRPVDPVVSEYSVLSSSETPPP